MESNSFLNNSARTSEIVLTASPSGALRFACFSLIHFRQEGDECTLKLIVAFSVLRGIWMTGFNVPISKLWKQLLRQAYNLLTNGADSQTSINGSKLIKRAANLHVCCIRPLQSLHWRKRVWHKSFAQFTNTSVLLRLQDLHLPRTSRWASDFDWCPVSRAPSKVKFLPTKRDCEIVTRLHFDKTQENEAYYNGIYTDGADDVVSSQCKYAFMPPLRDKTCTRRFAGDKVSRWRCLRAPCQEDNDDAA